ncbi:hypothetical protein [Massilia putida]|uniref:hypothetical protein n=1 Tax=Massilia putida TaxID=1141883 RepID=UPI0012EB6FAF|nr:hypothetical protein [Massilia putida]
MTVTNGTISNLANSKGMRRRPCRNGPRWGSSAQAFFASPHYADAATMSRIKTLKLCNEREILVN